MDFEKYTRVFEKLDARIKTGKSLSLDFDWGEDSPARLFFAGETAISYLWKSEPDYQQIYRRIDDSLSVEEAEQEAAGPTEAELLTEIRDLLKEKKN